MLRTKRVWQIPDSLKSFLLCLFVPNISIGIPVVKCIRPVTDLPLDVHLMIDRPVRYVEQFCDAGGDLITCHVEADTEENIHSAIVKIHAKGNALNPEAVARIFEAKGRPSFDPLIIHVHHGSE